MLDDTVKPAVIRRRRKRPHWAINSRSLAQHVIGRARWRQLKIAELYWLENWPAPRIAKRLAVSVNAVEQVIKRLRCLP
jgi:hypothetical protein